MALTLYFRGEDEKARAMGRRTVELNPRNALWLSLMGLYLIQQEFFEEGVDMVRRSIALTPHPPAWIKFGLFLDHYYHGRYQEALREIENTDLPEDFRMPLLVAAIHGRLGNAEQTAAALKDLRRYWPGPMSALGPELLERHAFSRGMIDRLLQGVANHPDWQDPPGQSR